MKTTRVHAPTALAVLCLSACHPADPPVDSHPADGSENDTDTDTDTAESDTAEPDTAEPDTGESMCPDCAPGEGCVSVEVGRVKETSSLPWEWAGNKGNKEIDGIGTLIVSVVVTPEGKDDQVLTRVTHADADMRLPEALYELELGCVPAQEEIRLVAFLDDDLNAMDSEYLSGTFTDACMNSPRQLPCTLSEGESITAQLSLSSQCYHHFEFPDSSVCRR